MRISGVLRSALLVVLPGLLSAAMLYGAALLAVPVPLSGPIGDGSANGRERGWFTTRGFHRPEVESSPSRHFSWTSGHAEIRVPNIDRTRPYRVSFRIRAGRSATTEPPPHLIVSVDAVPRLRTETSNARQDYAVEVPTDNRSTLVVAIDLSDTFVPGPGDPRELGVVVEQVDIVPVDGRWRPTPYVALLVALATMAAAAVAVACGFPASWTLVAGTLVSAVHVWLLTRDGAFLGHYADRLIHIAIGIAVAGAIVTVARRQWPAPVTAPDWSIAVGVTLIAAALKIALFGHPNVALADSIFQVHRAQNVVAGQYFFTSITPRPFFEFPYAIALYVTALPLWDWFPSELDRVRLLRGVTIAADALVGVAMYFALRRAWPERGVALAFALLWPFARSPANTLCTSNLTNLYGQGLFGAAMGLVAWMAASGHRRPGAIVAATGLLTGAYLSHFSTVSVGVPLALTVGIFLIAGGSGETRRLGVWVLAMVVTAAAVSYVVYYSHFHAVYRATADRVLAGDGANDERSMAAPIAVKVDRWQSTMRMEFGVPALITAGVGAIWILRRPRNPALLVLGGWGLTWVGFAALGIATPVQMRANLAAAPFVLAMASFAIGMLAARSVTGLAVAAIAGIAIASDGFTRWMHCLTG